MRKWRKQISVFAIAFILFTYFMPFASAETLGQPATDTAVQQDSTGSSTIVPVQPSEQGGSPTSTETGTVAQPDQSGTAPSTPQPSQPEENPTMTEGQATTSTDATTPSETTPLTTSPQQENLKGVLVKGQEVLANVTFSFHSVDSSGQNVVWYDVTTNENGTFTSVLPDGEYQIDGVWVSPHWYVLEQKFSMVNGALVGANELVVDVAAKSSESTEKDNVLGTLKKGTDVLKGITFSVHTLDGSKWYDATTDEAGQFGFKLPDGTYQLDGVWVGSESKWYAFNNYQFVVENGVLKDMTALVIDVKATNNSQAESNVKGTLKKGVDVLQGVTFSVHTLDGSKWYDATTDEAGQFGFKLPDGTYQLDGVWVGSESKWYAFNNYQFVVENGVLKDMTALAIDVKATNNSQAESNVKGTLKKGVDVLQGVTFSVHTLDGSKWYDATTDEAGQFGLKLPDGTYQLDGVWVGSESKWYAFNNYQFVVENGVLKDMTALVIDVKATNNSQAESNVKGTLKKGVDVLQGVTFSVHTLDGSKWYDATTDEAGQFGFKLPDGTYQLDGVWVGSENKWYAFNDYTFTVENGALKGATELLIDVEEMGPVTFKGTLLDGNTPVENATIWVQRQDGSGEFVETTTDVNGHFAFRLSDGVYYVTDAYSEQMGAVFLNKKVEILNGKVVVDGKEVNDLQITVPSYQLKAKVVEDGTTVEHATIYFEPAGAVDFYYYVEIDGNSSIEPARLADGEYHVSKLTVGDKDIDIDVPFTVENGQLFVNDEKQDVLTINVPKMTFKGQLVDANGILANATVFYEETGNSTEYAARTDVNGYFTGTLGEGSYRVYGVSVDQQYIELNVLFEIKNGKVVVNGQEVETLVVKVPSVNFRGTVVEQDQKPVSSARVEVAVNNSNRIYIFNTDQQGSFAGRLPDGDYKIEAADGVPVNILFSIQNDEMYVNGKKQSSLTVTLPPVSVFGKVYETGNVPLANAWVSVHDESYNYWHVQTDSEGNFHLRVPDGKFVVSDVYEKASASLKLPFEVNNGTLIVNGVVQEKLELTVPPITVLGDVYEEDGVTLVPYAFVDVVEDKTGETKNYYYGNANENGQVGFRLLDGNYKIESIQARNSRYLSDVSFSVVNGQLYVNGEKQERLKLKLSPITLTGQLLDENGEPIQSAHVSVDGKKGYYEGGTDENGVFRLPLLDDEYTLSRVRVGEQTFSIEPITFMMKNGKLYINGEQQETLTVRLLPVTLKGKLLSADGIPLENTSVDIRSSNYKYYSTQTDFNGEFESRLPDGSYEIYGYYSTKDRAWIRLGIHFEITNGQLYVNGEKQASLLITAPKLATITGYVEDNGVPVASQTNVWYRSVDDTGVTSIQTDENGRISVALKDGEYVITEVSGDAVGVVEMDLRFTVQDGKLFVNGTEQESLTISLPKVTVQGQVFDSAGPVKDAGFNVYKVTDGVKVYDHYQRTNADGNFILRVPDGEYVIQDVYVNSSSVPVDVSFSVQNGKLYIDGEQQEKLLLSIPNVNVKGTLFSGDSPVANASIQLIEGTGDATRYFGMSTNEDGYFESRLKDGNYKVTGFWTQKDGHVPMDVSFSIVNGKLMIDGQEQQELKLTALPVTIKGILKDNNGNLANVYINLKNTKTDDYFSATTDANGNFSFRLPDGEYFLDGVSLQDKGWVRLNRTIVIKNGTTEPSPFVINIDDPIPVYGNVQGTVLDGDKPLGKVNVEIKNEDTQNWMSTQTNDIGQFGLTLEDGNYRITQVYGTNFPTVQLNQVFSVQNGQLFMDGATVDKLTVKIPAMIVLTKLVEGETPLANTTVYLTNVATNETFNVQTNSAGEIKERLADGDYFVGDAYTSDYRTFSIHRTVTVANGQTSVDVIDVNGEIPTYEVKGALFDGGSPLANTTVYIRSTSHYDYVKAQTNKDGQFSAWLKDGVYTIDSVANKDEKVSLQPWNMSFTVVNGKVKVNGAIVPSLQIHLPPVTFVGKLQDGAKILANQSFVVNSSAIGWSDLSTNENGEFKLRLPDGEHVIYSISIEGIGKEIPLNQSFEIKNGVATPNPVVIDLSKPVPVTGTVKGVVVDENGNPVRFATIRYKDDRYGWWETTANSLGEFGLQSSDGNYTIMEVEGKTVGYTTTKVNIPFSVQNGVLMVNGQEKDKLTIQLPPITVFGAVKDNVGPISNATLSIHDLNDWNYYNAITDNDGQFGLRLVDSQYELSVFSQGTITSNLIYYNFEVKNGKLLVNGVELNQLTISLPPVTLKGTVVENDVPIRDAMVLIAKNNSTTSTSGAMPIQLDKNGVFSARLEDGEYVVLSVYPFAYGGEIPVNIPFTIEGGVLKQNGETKESLVVPIPSKATVEGQVTNNGVPLRNQEFYVNSSSGNSYRFSTDGNGKFSLRLPDGEYNIKSIWLPDLGEVTLNRKIIVENGTTDPSPYNIEITDLFPISGNVKGVVLVGEKPVATGNIVVVNKDTSEQYNVPVNTLGEFGIDLKDGTYSVDGFYDSKGYDSISKVFQVQDGKIVVDGTIQDKLTLFLQPVGSY